MYTVLARKWRPQGFDELIGQRHVAQTLANAIRSGRLAHAYLFAGVRGTGKTTVARILAKCLNCEHGPTPEPCGRCTPCVEITEGRALDVLELDAASRTQVDNIRELQELISYAPVRDRYKVLIIDEAHMLSKAAFNALLKTLEEPPPRVVFVLATTELHKVLPTIVSRCQLFEFRRVGAPEVARQLQKLCEHESLRISTPSLERIARAGEGSVRDSLSVLERVVAFCGQDVADDDVLRLLGAVRGDVLAELLRALAARDAAGMLVVLDSLIDEGHDLVQFWNELIGALRDVLVRRAAGPRLEPLSRSADELEALDAAAGALSREDLSRAFQILADLEPALKSSAQPRFLFEGTLIRLASLGAVRPIEELLGAVGGTATPRAPRAPAPAPAPAPPEKKSPAVAAEGALGPRLVAAALEARPMLGALLQEGDTELDGDALVVRFAAGREALGRTLQRAENVEQLQTLASELIGRRTAVRIELAGARPPETAAAPEPGLLEQAKREPGVTRLLREFGAQVVDIRPMGAAEPLSRPEDAASAEEPV
ncbi:MAG TPA: DNA polymerase III subunit gamma/tau [Candidatus Polarisedimenticolaceae bacterium]|nr:DNA polymerase III subunit gamma/tau [Candidatus Polarisedimenticolaceae bacterium]